MPGFGLAAGLRRRVGLGQRAAGRRSDRPARPIGPAGGFSAASPCSAALFSLNGIAAAVASTASSFVDEGVGHPAGGAAPGGAAHGGPGSGFFTRRRFLRFAGGHGYPIGYECLRLSPRTPAFRQQHSIPVVAPRGAGPFPRGLIRPAAAPADRVAPGQRARRAATCERRPADPRPHALEYAVAVDQQVLERRGDVERDQRGDEAGEAEVHLAEQFLERRRLPAPVRQRVAEVLDRIRGERRAEVADERQQHQRRVKQAMAGVRGADLPARHPARAAAAADGPAASPAAASTSSADRDADRLVQVEPAGAQPRRALRQVEHPPARARSAPAPAAATSQCSAMATAAVPGELPFMSACLPAAAARPWPGVRSPRHVGARSCRGCRARPGRRRARAAARPLRSPVGCRPHQRGQLVVIALVHRHAAVEQQAQDLRVPVSRGIDRRGLLHPVHRRGVGAAGQAARAPAPHCPRRPPP